MMNIVNVISKLQSSEKRDMLKLNGIYEEIASKENCSAVFGYNNDCFCILDAKTIVIGNAEMAVRIPVCSFKSIFDICKEMQQTIASVGFSFNGLRFYPETVKSAANRKQSWLNGFAF